MDSYCLVLLHQAPCRDEPSVSLTPVKGDRPVPGHSRLRAGKALLRFWGNDAKEERPHHEKRRIVL